MNKRNNNNGITLIALIITIIVMLILAMVTINIAISGGIIEKTVKAKDDTQVEIDREQITSIIVEKYISNSDIEGQDLPEGWEVNNNVITSKSGNKFYYNRNGEIELVVEEVEYTNLIFEVTNAENKEVSVKANKGEDGNSLHCDIGDNIRIPGKILKNNEVYTVTSIALGGFGCTTIKQIDIPDTITTIEQDAFTYCTQLTNIDIPDSVTRIDGYAFSDCTSISSITIRNNVTTMASYVFNNWNSSQRVNVFWSYGNKPAGWLENWDATLNYPNLVPRQFSISYGK